MAGVPPRAVRATEQSAQTGTFTNPTPFDTYQSLQDEIRYWLPTWLNLSLAAGRAIIQTVTR